MTDTRITQIIEVLEMARHYVPYKTDDAKHIDAALTAARSLAAEPQGCVVHADDAFNEWLDGNPADAPNMTRREIFTERELFWTKAAFLSALQDTAIPHHQPQAAAPVQPMEPHPPSRHCMCAECRPSFDDDAIEKDDRREGR